MNIGDTILIAVISGMIASFCYSLAMLIIRPRIVIAKQMAKWKEIYYVKVINKTFSTVTDLDYSMYYCVNHGDGVSTTIEIQALKDKLILIDRNKPLSKKFSDNALQLTYAIDTTRYPINDSDRYIEFHVLGNHIFSGTKKCTKRTFYLKDIKEGVFETGNSVNILVNHHIEIDPANIKESESV